MAQKRRLLWQIYPSYLLITLAALAVVTWYASTALRQFYIDRTADDLRARARLMQSRFAPLLATGADAEVDALCKQLGAAAATRITVIRPDGKVVGDSVQQPATMENHADRPEVVEALAGRVGAALHYSHTLQEQWRYVAVPVDHDGHIVGVLRTSLSLATIDTALAGIRRRIIVGALFVAALLAGLSLVFSRRITRPLEELQRGAARFAHGDLAYRLPAADALETAALAETLNQMAAELDDKMHAVLRQRNEREAILASMIEGVLAVDGEQRVLRMNQAAARLAGIDPERAIGHTLPEVLRNAELQRLVGGVLATRTPQEGEIVLRAESGRVLHVHATDLHGPQGGPSGALVVLHDVTQLRRLERMRRDFVANVSHELRTPVTSIKGFIETLLDGAMHNPEELERFLRIAAAQSDRLNAIIEDLLTLSRLEADKDVAEISLAPGAIHDVLAAAIEVCAAKATQKQIAMALTCDATLRAPLNAPLLEQAVVNLLDNAIKFSAAGQTVDVQAAAVGSEVAIRVRDRGCGIAAEHLPRIFERFYRVDKARSRKLGGTGLGLAIVKHIAQAHGGRATVESVPGQGSTFTIFLPGGN